MVPTGPVSCRFESVAIPADTDSPAAPDRVRSLSSSDTAVMVRGCDDEAPVVTRLASASWISTTTAELNTRLLAAAVAPDRATVVAAP